MCNIFTYYKKKYEQNSTVLNNENWNNKFFIL